MPIYSVRPVLGLGVGLGLVLVLWPVFQSRKVNIFYWIGSVHQTEQIFV